MNDILTVSDVPHEAKLFRWAPHCWHSPVAQPHIRLVTKHLLQEFTSFFRPQSEEISAIMEQSIVWWILWIHNAFPRKLRTFLTRAMILTLALDYYQSILPVFSNTSQPISQVTALHQHQSTHNSLAFVESFCDFMIAGRLCLMIPCPLPWSPSPTDFTSRPGSYFMFFFSLGMFWVLPVHSFCVFRSLFCCILFFFFKSCHHDQDLMPADLRGSAIHSSCMFMQLCLDCFWHFVLALPEREHLPVRHYVLSP